MSSIYTANIPNPYSIGSRKVAARLAGRGSASDLPVPLPAVVLVQVVRAIRGMEGLEGAPGSWEGFFFPEIHGLGWVFRRWP